MRLPRSGIRHRLLRRGRSSGAKDGDQHQHARPDAPAVVSVETAPETGRQSPFYALRFRNFRLYFIGQLISVAGTWMQTIAQQWLVWSLTHSAAWLGIISGASAIPYVAFSFWGGQVADRVSRRLTMIWTQAALMVLAFALAALAKGWPVPVQAWHVAVLSGLAGVVNAFTMPAAQAFVVDIVDERSAIGNAIALNSLRFNLARFLGPIMAGAVLASYGVYICFLVNAVSFIAVIISLLMMRLNSFTALVEKAPFIEGLRYIRHTRRVLRIVMMVGSASIFAWSVSTVYPIFASLFHKGATGYSYIMAANGVGAAIGGLFTAWIGERISRRLLVYGGAILFCIGLLLLTTAHSFPMALVWLTLSGFSMIVFGISANTRIQTEVPDALRGRVMAVYSLVFGGLMPVGGLEIGFLAQHVSTITAVRVNTFACLVVSAALFVWSEIDLRRSG